MEQIKFTADRSGERIDRFLSENLENLSRSYIQKLLKDGENFRQSKLGQTQL